jgi:hypothetical protein
VHPFSGEATFGSFGFAMFRMASWGDVAFLAERDAAFDADERHRAAPTLLETRLPAAFAFVLEHAPEHLAYLPGVGYEQTAKVVQRLYPEQSLHMTAEGCNPPRAAPMPRRR